MRTLIEKEIRLLLPAFVGALVLAILPVWLVPYDRWNPSALPIYLYLFGAVLLALSSFGREISLKTLSFMLAQPLERGRIWWTKIAVLAVFLALGFDAWWLSASLCSIHRPALLLPPEDLGGFGLFVAVFAAGGLWMTLLLRQTVAAFWLTLLIPMAASSALKLIGATNWMIFTSLGLYAVAGFFLARGQFLHVQDTAWTGGVLTLGRTPAVTEGYAVRAHRPWAALLRKELQLQQVTLIGMVGLLVLHLGVLLVRKVGAQVLGKSILSALEMFGWLWLMVPLLVGAQSVADERQLGTLDGLLCLPFSRRIQFTVKLIIVLVLGGLLSAALLYAAEGVGSAIGVGAKLGGMMIAAPLLVVLFFLLLALLGFYASTLTRGMVPALAAGAVVSIVFFMVNQFASRATYAFGWRLWPVVAEPTLLAAVIWLAFGNFRYVFESGRRWRRNILGLIAVLALTSGSLAAVYHRVWELPMPLEGPHGSARLPAGKPVLVDSFYNNNTLAVLLPDGRLWQDRIVRRPDQPSVSGNHFAAGSNWVAASLNWRGIIGIRSDGTFWASEKPRPSLTTSNLPINYKGWLEDGPTPFVQFGIETNWQSVAGSLMVLLKRDGTLWSLEKKSVDSKSYQGLLALEAHRLGMDSDWSRILQGNQGVYAWKRDGGAWNLHEAEFDKAGRLLHSDVQLDAGTAAYRLPELDHLQFKNLKTYPMSDSSQVGVRDDGTLWYWDWRGRGVTQIGHDTNWAEVAGGPFQVLALRTDGSLWEWHWNLGLRQLREKLQEAPVRMGTHQDWAAVGYWLGDTVALAADGALWRCSKRNAAPDWMGGTDLWLAPSRRPSEIVNIFGLRE
jgi:ABC-type transport system involved in multi-copper enzyme maturation permease subunit